MSTTRPSSSLSVHYLGGPTAVLEMAGVRLLTDPTFDEPGDYPIGNRKLVKTAGPALGTAEIGSIDAVLLSHDQHPDNLDRSGRGFLDQVPLVLSTPSARERIGGPVRALTPWEEVKLPRPDGGSLNVTALPAQHGPDGTEHLVGEVTGFMLSGDDLPTVYVSGDNASLDVVRTIADRCPPCDVALLFAGGAQTPLLGDEYLTLCSYRAADAAQILGTCQIIPLHFEQWGHFTQGADTLTRAFDQAGIADRLRLPSMGELIHV